MKFMTTKQFDKAVESIKRKHDKKLKSDLIDILNKIYTQTLGASHRNHPLKDANGLNDVHLRGDIIILYRYDVDSDTLVISAKMHDIVNHDQLNRKTTFREKQGYEQDFDKYIKDIQSSTDIYTDDIDFEYVDDWFTDYYNEVIAPIICIDDIRITDIEDFGEYLHITTKGIQYTDACPLSHINDIETVLNSRCNRDNVQVSLTYNINAHFYGDLTSYELVLYLIVPLSY